MFLAWRRKGEGERMIACLLWHKITRQLSVDFAVQGEWTRGSKGLNSMDYVFLQVLNLVTGITILQFPGDF